MEVSAKLIKAVGIFVFAILADGNVINLGKNCKSYLAGCDQNNQMECCLSPMILCLPDSRGGTSCVSPLDALNVAPQVSSHSRFATFVAAIQNATIALVKLTPNLLAGADLFGG